MGLDTAFIILLVVIVIMVIAYFVLMKWFPEAVGISGTRAKKIEREHQGDENEKPKKDFLR